MALRMHTQYTKFDFLHKHCAGNGKITTINTKSVKTDKERE